MWLIKNLNQKKKKTLQSRRKKQTNCITKVGYSTVGDLKVYLPQ